MPRAAGRSPTILRSYDMTRDRLSSRATERVPKRPVALLLLLGIALSVLSQSSFVRTRIAALSPGARRTTRPGRTATLDEPRCVLAASCELPFPDGRQGRSRRPGVGGAWGRNMRRGVAKMRRVAHTGSIRRSNRRAAQGDARLSRSGRSVAGSSHHAMLSNSPGFLRLSGSFGFSLAQVRSCWTDCKGGPGQHSFRRQRRPDEGSRPRRGAGARTGRAPIRALGHAPCVDAWTGSWLRLPAEHPLAAGGKDRAHRAQPRSVTDYRTIYKERPRALRKRGVCSFGD